MNPMIDGRDPRFGWNSMDPRVGRSAGRMNPRTGWTHRLDGVDPRAGKSQMRVG